MGNKKFSEVIFIIKMATVGGLFSGIGGIELGFESF